jgi:hypothetical protein
MEYIILFLFINLNNLLFALSKKSIFVYFSIISLILFAGLRYNVGVDYGAYVKIYSLIERNIAFEGMVGVPSEKGYVLLVKLLLVLGAEQQLLFLIFAIITQIFTYKFIKHNSINIVYSILIYLCLGPFFLGGLNLIRQAAAVALFAYITKYIISKNFFKYFIYIIIGTLFFHTSLILMLPFYFFLNINYSKKKILIIIILEILLSKVIIYLINLTPYKIYFIMKFNNATNITTVFYFGISIMVYLFIQNVANNNIVKNMLLFSILLQMLGFIDKSFAPEIIYRMNYYFFVSIIVLMPEMFKNIKNKNLRIAFKMVMFIAFSIIFFRTALIKGADYKLIPYNINLKIF